MMKVKETSGIGCQTGFARAVTIVSSLSRCFDESTTVAFVGRFVTHHYSLLLPVLDVL